MAFQEGDNTQELMEIFHVESEEILERIFENLALLELNPRDKEVSATLYRDLHSIKGAIRMVGFTNIQTIIHKIEDIFDFVNSAGIVLDSAKINTITKSIEIVSRYLQDSVKNQREIIGDEFNPTVSALEYLCDIELADEVNQQPAILADLAAIAEGPNLEALSIAEATVQSGERLQANNDFQAHQEVINYGFNSCFEIIDSITPEEETQETVMLREEVAKIYDILKESDFIRLFFYKSWFFVCCKIFL